MSNPDDVLIGFNISTTDPSAGLGIRVYIDQVVVHENFHVKESYNFSHTISDNDGEHELAFELFGKMPTHTKINESGQIIEDAMLTIADITIDDIDIKKIIDEKSQYFHDFNNTAAATEDKFYGDLGCNGVVKLKFSTPFYLWLLENM